MTLFVVGLTLAASLSPLFTTTHLFQMKEWRWDRLREHLRSEGWLTSLFGRLRPIIVLSGTALLQLSALYLLAVLTLLNIAQITLKKQPYPVWTKKATVLIATSTFFTTAASYGVWVMGYGLFLVFLPLLQPIFLLAAWIVWKPVDALLKYRILKKAKTLRTQFPDLVVIGITGSAGKTTTKELLAHLLSPDRAIASPEHVNSELGVAQWIMKTLKPMCHGELVEPSHRLSGMSILRQAQDDTPSLLVIEMGAYRQGEIATICAAVQPTMGIITNIGTQHIGLFGSQRAIAEAKGELFVALPPNGHAFVNIDTPYAQELQKKCRCPVTTVSTGNAADFLATHAEETINGLRFRVRDTPFTVPLHGDHQLGNVLLAIAAAEKLGMTLENIAQKLITFQPPPHTFSLREENGVTILDDTHNASPESLRAAIEWARHQPHPRKILITPGIIEQGLAAARLHFQCGALAKDVFDEAFVLNKKFAQFFAEGFGKSVSSNLKHDTYHLKPGSLLALIGRVPQNTIQKFLP